METVSPTASTEKLNQLTMHEIQMVLKAANLPMSREHRRSKAQLVDYVSNQASSQVLHELLLLAAGKKKRRRSETDGNFKALKRVQQETLTGGEEEDEDIDLPSAEIDIPKHFLRAATRSQREECYARFYQATSNAALETCVCAVCGRECSVREDGVLLMPLTLMPNSHRLQPKMLHGAHDLFDGKLLDPAGVTVGVEDPIVTVCRECMQDLKKSREAPPKFALANRMWIGKIPWELQVLTFPEQLLIALLYPRVYVFKLYPKRQLGGNMLSNLQRAMRGNVSTYRLNTDAVADMVKGKLMPRPPEILASLISVNFIAVGEVPKAWLHPTFRVRWTVLLRALQWLKQNNPKYYGDIEISEERLNELPEDDVPEEINAIVRQTEDTGILEEETDGYVPRDENEGMSTIVISSFHLQI